MAKPEDKKQSSWGTRSLIAVLVVILCIVLTVLGLRIWITTSSGSRFIENQVNSRSLGPIKRAEISGLSGDPLEAFSLGSLKLYDENGLWLSVADIQMEWSPWGLRDRHLILRDLDIASVEVFRRPILDVTESVGSGKPFAAKIDNADIAAVILQEPVIGRAAALRVDGRGGLFENGDLKAAVNIVRTDAAGDEVKLDFTRSAGGNISGDFVLNGVAGGTIATLLRAPDSVPITGRGTVDGSLAQGEGIVLITFADTQAIDANLNWTAETANLNSDLNLTDWPLFEQARDTLGPMLAVEVGLNRTQPARPFTARIEAQNFDADVSGELGEEGFRPEAMDFDIRSSRLGGLVPLPEGYSFGESRAQGRLNLGNKLSGRATVTLADVVSPYLQAEQIFGQVSVSPDEGIYLFETTLTARRPVATRELPIVLGEKAVLKAEGQADLDARRVTNLDATLVSGQDRLNAKGRLALNGSTLNLSGAANARLKSMGPLPAGQIDTRYELVKTATSDLAVSADGNFVTDTDFSPPLDAIMGRTVNFDVNMQPVLSGIRVTDGRIRTEGLRTAFSGLISDRLDLSAEVSTLEPLTYGAVSMTSPSNISATVTGPRTDPNLRLDGTVAGMTLGGQAFTDLRLRTELTDLTRAPKGPVRIQARTEYGPLDISARMSSTEAGYAVEDLEVQLVGLTAGGDMALGADNIATGRLALNLPQEGERYARAFLDLNNLNGEQGITLRAEAENIAYQDYAIETLSARLSGSLKALNGQIDLEGREIGSLLVREFSLASPVSLARNPDTGYRLSLSPTAEFGRFRIGHREALTLNYDEGQIGIDAPLTVNDQPLDLNYSRAKDHERLRVRATDIPMSVFPLPGALAETNGTFSLNGNARQSEAEPLSGQITAQLKDWRGYDIERGSGISLSATVDLQPGAAIWRVVNQGTTIFELAGEGRFPLLSGESLVALRPNMTAAMSGVITASGSAKPLLNLVTLDDARPDGTLQAELDIAGTLAAPRIEGQASGQKLKLELPRLGARLRNGQFTADFTNDTIRVRDVFVADSKDGTLSGAGQFTLGEFGRPIGRLELQAKDFRALDRKDYEGQASGTLFFESTAEKALLGGNVKFDRAEVKQFVAGRASVIEIEVEEINGSMDELEAMDRPPATPLYLDLRVRAPRRIFVRTRGLDVELEMDVTLKGTVSAPEIYGTASVVRGGYKIAGKTLEFTNGSIIFDGKLGDATVDLSAETQTQNISATVEIGGTVEKPEITLSSRPERPQDEILSALLFGRSVTELSAIEAAQLAGALAQFSGAGGGFDLVGGLRDALGIGQLSIGVDEDGQATVSGGRYLANDVYLQVFSGAGPDSSGAIIDWEILQNLSLRSRVQADSEQSFSLSYKKSF